MSAGLLCLGCRQYFVEARAEDAARAGHCACEVPKPSLDGEEELPLGARAREAMQRGRSTVVVELHGHHFEVDEEGRVYWRRKRPAKLRKRDGKKPRPGSYVLDGAKRVPEVGEGVTVCAAVRDAARRDYSHRLRALCAGEAACAA